MELIEQEKEVVEKIKSIEKLVLEARLLVEEVNSLTTQHKLNYPFPFHQSFAVVEFDKAGHKVVDEIKNLVDSLGWRSSSLGC